MLARKFIATGLTAVVLAVAVVNGVPARVSALGPSGISNLKGLSNITVSAASGETLFAAADGKLYSSTDAGLSWNLESLPRDAQAGAVATDPALAQRIFVGDAKRTSLYMYNPQRKNWAVVDLAVKDNAATRESGGIVDLAVDRSGQVFAATHSDGVYQMALEDNALRTESHALTGQPISSLAVDESGRAYVVSNNQIYQSGARIGADWQPLGALPSRPTALVLGTGNPATLYVGTESNGLIRSNDGGNTWLPANTGLAEQPGARLTVTALTVDSSNRNLIYAATAYWIGDLEASATPGILAMSADGGSTWTRMSQLEAVVDHLSPSPLGVGRVFAASSARDTSAVTAIALNPAAQVVPVAAQTVRHTTSAQSPIEQWLGIDLTLTQWISWGVALLALAMLAAILLSSPQAKRTAQMGR